MPRRWRQATSIARQILGLSGLADCLCELAIQFRQPDGTGLALDWTKTQEEITERVQSLRNRP